MNTAAATSVDSGVTADLRHRRSREEMETLAQKFVGAPTDDAPPARPRTRLAFAAGGIAVLAALVVMMSWPARDEGGPRPQVDKARAATEAEQWRARYEAERERKRKELAAGSDYLARMAAADSAIQKEMSERASRLTAATAATPAPAAARQASGSTEPTPRDEPAPRKSTPVASAAPAPQPAKSQPAPEKAAASPAPAQKAETAPQPTTVAAAPQCKLHVSQLSASGTLTYDAVARMKGARKLGDGAVVLPPVTADGRRVVFTVTPDGCMTWRRA